MTLKNALLGVMQRCSWELPDAKGLNEASWSLGLVNLEFRNYWKREKSN